MTREEKQLLLKDLCARLPYGVKCYYNSPEIDDDVPEGISVIKGFQNEGVLVEIESGDVIDIDYVKPYLRPMSSMTDEEKKEYTSYCFEQPFLQKDKTPNLGSVPMCIDWLNKNMFDYRGLIPMGLALEAPKDMYKIK